MVGGQLDDTVAEADVFGSLPGGGKKYFRCGRMGIFLKEMMLDLPGIVLTKFVSELDLVQ